MPRTSGRARKAVEHWSPWTPGEKGVPMSIRKQDSRENDRKEKTLKMLNDQKKEKRAAKTLKTKEKK